MKLICTLVLIAAVSSAGAQVNAYARVDAINSTTITISAQNESYGSFTPGMELIIMQMQDDVIGGNTANNASFGDLATVASAGMYEVAVISSVVRSAGVITSIHINSPLSKTFNTGSNSSVQAISFPQMGTGDYSTTADITALPWNGSYGGVIAFKVNGKLTLNHNITADYAGFRGGSVNAGNAGSCEYIQYTVAANELNANKGEGIYKVTNTLYAAGRGKIINGGGGGNSHNGGGGGGSNLKAGGEGGKGYQCTSAAGGLGGVALGTFATTERIFMGGGAGAGEANNGFNSAGANGGGIIIIKANEVNTVGSGATVRISANGATASNVGNDGAGGGGAAGTILFSVKTWNIAATKTLAVSADGGSGGSVTDGAFHGGGGGGSQGAVFYSTAVPTTNIVTTTLIGKGGRNHNGGTFASNAAGNDNEGIFSGSMALLPVTLVSFQAERTGADVELSWKTQREQNVAKYVVERSMNGVAFSSIAEIAIKNNSRELQQYTYTDKDANGSTIYYRLRIVDYDGSYRTSAVAIIRQNNSAGPAVYLFPNPVVASASLKISSAQMQKATVRILSMTGAVVGVQHVQLNKGDNIVSLDHTDRLTSGVYQVAVSTDGATSVVRMLVQK